MSIFYRAQSGGGGAAPTIVSKTITANGIYNASSDSADGYDPVTVSVGLAGSVALHSGKVNLYDGTITADPDYCYSDPIPIPNGHMSFDLGYTASGSYNGFTLYKGDDSYYDYYKPTVRYRYIDLSSEYQNGARYMILCFEVAYLNDVIFILPEDSKIYTGNPNYSIYTLEP